MKKTLMILASAALFVSCGDDSKIEDTFTPQNISISSDAIAAEADGTIASNSVTVTSSADWILEGDTSWCTPSAVKGGNGATVTFSADPNEGDQARSVNLYFICGDAARKLTVTQSSTNAVEFINGQSFAMPAIGGILTLKLNSNLNTGKNFEISEEWVSLRSLPGSPSGLQWIQFKIDSHQNFEPREATITLFKGTDAESVISIAQEKYVGVRFESISDFEFGVDGGTATVTASANVNFNSSITTANATWISATETSSTGTDVITKTFEITCSDCQYYRAGVVTLAPTSTGSLATVNITQRNPNAELFDVPDPVFSARLVALGYIVANGNKYEVTHTGYTASSLSISENTYSAIATVEGIEKFVNLTTLTLSSMNVRRMDLSKNTKLTSLTNNYVPLEEFILGDLNFTSRSISYLYNNRSTANRAQSFTLSSSKVTSLTLNQTSNTGYDEVEWIDVTGCPALRTLSCNRSSGKLKHIYLTQTQKDAYDSGTLTITTNAAFDKTEGIVVR